MKIYYILFLPIVLLECHEMRRMATLNYLNSTFKNNETGQIESCKMVLILALVRYNTVTDILYYKVV